MPRLKDARPQPLLNPPPEKPGHEPWMAATSADRRLIENALGWASGSGMEVAELFYHSRGIGVDAPMGRPAREKVKSALDSAREDSSRRQLAKLLFLSGRLGIDQGDTGRDAEILAKPYPKGSASVIFERMNEAYYRSQIGVDSGITAPDLFKECLRIARFLIVGPGIAEAHHISGELGNRLEITDADKEVMKKTLNKARRDPNAADVAKMLFLLERLFPKEAPKEPPPVPPLKKFAG